MSVLKIIEKDKVKFLMDFDYNNVLGRLKSVLGKDAYFFADVRVRKNDITWLTKEDIILKPFSEASEIEKQSIKACVDSQIGEYRKKISEDSLIGDYVQQITTYPSDLYIYYALIEGKYKIVLTGWGCEDTIVSNTMSNNKDEYNDYKTVTKGEKSNISSPLSSTGAKDRVSSATSNQEQGFMNGGIFVDGHQNNNRKKVKPEQSKLNIFKSVVLVLVAANLALIMPVFLTGAVNRFVANVTNQWYLNGASRVIITFFVAAVTYAVAYILIRFSTLGKSIVFNIVCFILTFIWSIVMGLAWIPD